MISRYSVTIEGRLRLSLTVRAKDAESALAAAALAADNHLRDDGRLVGVTCSEAQILGENFPCGCSMTPLTDDSVALSACSSWPECGSQLPEV